MAVVKYWFLTASISCVLLGTAHAEAVDDLTEALRSADNLVAVFVQTNYDETGRQVDWNRGEMTLAKPNVRWEVFEPFPQTILLTGMNLQIYDPDLEQVTQRDIGDEWGQVPLTLLTRNDVDLDTLFEVREQPQAEGSHLSRTFVLTSLGQEKAFEQIEVTFADGHLQRIVVADPFGQQTHVDFQAHIQQTIVPERFELQAPPGTDFVEG